MCEPKPDPERETFIERRDRWKHRRRMAYTCLVAGLVFPLFMLAAGADRLTAVAHAFYFFVGAVVGSYIGFATWDDRSIPRRRRED